MTRVSTLGSYQSALLNLFAAQNRNQDAQNRLATEKIATDLEGFGRSSETLTALKSSQARIQGFIDTGEAVAARLSAQDVGLTQVGGGAQGTRQAIADALAAGRVDGLMQAIDQGFQAAQAGLNSQHQGRYLFGGANVETPPVTAAGTFTNDTLKATSRLDEGTTVVTGVLASEVGADLFQIFADIRAYQAGTPVTQTDPGPPPVTTTYTPAAAGSIAGQPSEDVKTFLSAQLKRFDAEYLHITDITARNGQLQNRAEAVLKSQDDQRIALDKLLGDKTDADLAQAATDIQLSSIAIQASAQVINQLRQVSLLNYLS